LSDLLHRYYSNKKGWPAGISGSNYRVLHRSLCAFEIVDAPITAGGILPLTTLKPYLALLKS